MRISFNQDKIIEENKSLVKIKEKFQKKVANIRRVTKVTKGGKKFSFRVIVIIGNYLSKVGFGVGKAQEISDAILKATHKAKKNIIKIPITKNYTIHKLTIGNFCASKILLKPARIGTGIVAGGSTRLILQLAGIKNLVAKQLGTNNILNNTHATFNALKILSKSLIINKIKKTPIEKFYI